MPKLVRDNESDALLVGGGALLRVEDLNRFNLKNLTSNSFPNININNFITRLVSLNVIIPQCSVAPEE